MNTPPDIEGKESDVKFLLETITAQHQMIIELRQKLDSLDRLLVNAEEKKQQVLTSLNNSIYSKSANVWIAAWNTVARAETCKDPETATRWADCCLRDYKERVEEGRF